MTWVKVCGTTNLHDAQLAVAAGADALGFIFAPSPRRIDVAEAAEIIAQLPDGIEKIGVFVNETPTHVAEVTQQVCLSGVQLHGDEPAERMAEFRQALGERKIIKTLQAREILHAGQQQLAEYLSARGSIDAILLDSGSAQQRGGTGIPFAWEEVVPLAAAIREVMPLIIAGGLDAENVSRALRLFEPWGVDVVSGVERELGKKDEARLHDFVAAVRHTQASTKQKGVMDETSINVESSPTAAQPTEGSRPKRVRDVPGRFGAYGGRYVPETLMAALQELEAAYAVARKDKSFRDEYHRLLTEYAGRPTPLFLAERLTKQLGGAKIYLKREDLLHTGAHKINNCIGQALLGRRMGKHRIIAETGAGQHGVATATVCALFGMECVVYMGTEDMRRQELNVFRMKLLGAEVRGVDSGSRTLKDAINEAMRDWVTNVRTTHYLLGSVLGAHPYPTMVRDFHRVIGQEARKQILKAEGRLPSAVIACVGGGSNAIGVFYEFIKDPEVKLIGVEAGGRGHSLGEHAARFDGGGPGVLQGTYSYVLQDQAGQIAATHSVSAGLDYPAIGPEHALLHDQGRAEYVSASDQEALDACRTLARLEGIIPALESAHAVAECIKRATTMSESDIVIVNISGRGDKDIGILRENLGF